MLKFKLKMDISSLNLGFLEFPYIQQIHWWFFQTSTNNPSNQFICSCMALYLEISSQLPLLLLIKNLTFCYLLSLEIFLLNRKEPAKTNNNLARETVSEDSLISNLANNSIGSCVKLVKIELDYCSLLDTPWFPH